MTNQQPAVTLNQRRLRAVALALWLLLLATGTYLWLVDGTPTAAAAYEDMENLRSAVSGRVWIRRAHSLTALVGTIATMVLAATHLRDGDRRRFVAAFVGGAALGVGWSSGRWLPWNQLRFWGRVNGRGGFAVVDDTTYEFVDGTTVSSRLIELAFHTHTKVLVLALVIVAPLLFLRDRSASTAPDSEGSR